MNDPLPRILQGLNEVRNKQCIRHGIDPTRNQKQLTQYAGENAMHLAVSLDERWLEPTIVVGGITFLPGQARTVEQAFEFDCVHQWVEIDPPATDEQYVVDVASRTRSDDFVGSPLVSKSLPDGYEEFEKSRVPFDNLPDEEPITSELYSEYTERGIFE